jgi:hypothetical protein
VAASKPVALCTLVMPSGKRCRAVALRNQSFCRAHGSTHRLYERDRAFNPILERLEEKIAAMDTSELLHLLHQKLGRLPKTLSRFPDIAYTVAATMDRLDEINQMESNLKLQTQQNHILLTKIQKYQLNSNAYRQLP